MLTLFNLKGHTIYNMNLLYIWDVGWDGVGCYIDVYTAVN
jgi:hypothetical protein